MTTSDTTSPDPRPFRERPGHRVGRSTIGPLTGADADAEVSTETVMPPIGEDIEPVVAR